MDPFATLGLPRTFDIDLRAVEATHRELSRTLHPDRYVGASATERRQALAHAVEVNEAWRIVRDPVRRAQALLELGGEPFGEDGGPKADPAFLMEMLEDREALADAKSARNLDAVRRLAEAIEARMQRVEAELSTRFARGGERVALAGKVGQLRFYRRFLDEVSAIEDELAA
jgi:molecular chaperone HscB